jgi:hypothetical protein
MVMLNQDVDLSPTAIQEQFAEWSNDELAHESRDDGTILFNGPGALVIVAKIDVPIPWSELEGPCSTSLFWKNAADEIKQHKLHWIVTINGELEPLEMSKLLTQVTGSIMATCPAAIGVYWGNAAMVVPKDIFVEFVETELPERMPLDIWVDFRVGWEKPNVSAGAFTTGMAALGHMEIEVKGSPERPSELRERLVALATYLVENGPVIKDGDTVGSSNEERIKVKYSKSEFGHEGLVMRLNYEEGETKKPWWKVW